jgi:sortase A
MKRLAVFSSLMFTVTLLCLGQSSHRANSASTHGNGAIVGHLEIPRLHISVVVLEGATPNILAVAAGHIEGPSVPGPCGNMGIAAHRDTFFGSLKEIRLNDIITVKTISGNCRYLVNRTEVVAPTDIEVLHQTSNAELTLVTCYPFRYRGPSPKRFIVHARCIRNASLLSSGAHSEPDGE